jgi:hypothetical protein
MSRRQYALHVLRLTGEEYPAVIGALSKELGWNPALSAREI